MSEGDAVVTRRAIAVLFTTLGWAAGAQAAEQPQRLSTEATGPAAEEGRQTTAGGQPTGPKVVEEGLVPKSIHIPGTDVSLSISGYV